MTSTTVTATRPWLRESAPFLLTTFGISWGVWAVCLMLGGDIADPRTFVLWVVGTFGPTLAALALYLARVRGERQAALGWWPVAVLVVGGLPLLAGALVSPGATAGTADFLASVGGVLPFLAFSLFAGPLSEEFGWRGHLQPRLRRHLSPAWTSLVVGVAWAVWHAPLFLITGSSQSSMSPFSLEALLFFATMVPLSVAFWWVSERLRGGVPAAVLLHLVTNVGLTLMVFSPVPGQLVILVVTTLIAAVLLRRGSAGQPATGTGSGSSAP